MVIDLGLDDDEAKTVEGEWRKRFEFPAPGSVDFLWFGFVGEVVSVAQSVKWQLVILS